MPIPRFILLLVVLAAAAWAAFGWLGSHRQRSLGAALYHGDSPLAGTLQGHETALPTAATRCINCHETRQRSPLAAASGAAPRSYATPLDRDELTRAQPRRGGPPSTYDAKALCTLLRTGIDPAFVTLPPTMPRYDVSDVQCEALWAHLISR